MKQEWQHNNKELTEAPDNYLGFVYVITNTINNKKYIGQKQFWSRSKKRKESDWKKYMGSSKKLISEINENNEHLFKREILYMCVKKADMNYLEMKEQFDNNVLFSDDYYNEFMGNKVNSKHLSKNLLKQ